MEYFVTGATGFLGSELVRQLVEAGDDVVALVRTPAKAETLPESVSIVHGDVTEKDSMRDAMDGVDGVFHLAGWYRIGIDAVETAERVNVEGTRNVLELLAELDVPKGVYTSTVAVFSDTNGAVVDESHRHDGPHLSTYDRTKWAAHYEVAGPMMDDGLPLVVVMPGVIYGPGDAGPLNPLWERYLHGNLSVIPRGTGYCWGHVADTARGHRLAMDRGTPGEEYVIAGEPYTLVEILDLAESIVGIDAPRAISPRFFRLFARLAALTEPFIDLPPMYRAESLRVFGGVTYWADNAKAERELGLEHRPVEEGLGTYLDWKRQQLDLNG